MVPTVVPLVRNCPDCGEPHGKPRVPRSVGGGIELSISHAGELVAVAIATATPVGVDVEQVEGRRDVRDISALMLSDVEHREQLELDVSDRKRAILISWTRKEALTKAVGFGLRLSPRDIEITSAQDPPRLLAWTRGLPPEDVTLCDLPGHPRHVACLAVLGRCKSIVELDADGLLDGWRSYSSTIREH
ncbi:MAG: 4'-phosphopantetheinyl transferase family protein [Solirubrobacteraceae bacterium]